MELTQERLDQLKKLAGKANPGSWKHVISHPHLVVTARNESHLANWPIGEIESYNDAAFIAAASPDVVLGLLEKAEYWQGYAEALEKEKAEYYEQFDRLAEELGVFRETDPGKPETFAKFAEVYRRLKAEIEELQARFTEKKVAAMLKMIDAIPCKVFDGLRDEADTAKARAEKLEKEADWLAARLASVCSEQKACPERINGADCCMDCVLMTAAIWRAQAGRHTQPGQASAKKEEQCQSR